MDKKLTEGKVIGVNGNMITVEVEGDIALNEVGYVVVKDEQGEKRLKSEVIRIKETETEMQVFEVTKGVKIGDKVEFTSELLTVTLGPGLLGRIYDGLQNPLPELAEACGFFLQRGIYFEGLKSDLKWNFKATVKKGDTVTGGDYLGSVPEGVFDHKIMVPFNFSGVYKIKSISNGSFTTKDQIAVITDQEGKDHNIFMSFQWPVKIPVKAYKEKLRPTEQLITKIRMIDTFLPVAKGGTYCIPGPFGAGKTVLQHATSRNADVDIVIVAACGERAGEVVETLKEFPELTDPKTGKTLMERTIIIANTSSMPVAAREASVYTAVTLGEYYRQMGLDVLILADSTSRWAQAMREMSGRLEEIPGEEAFPAYLESVIASFYERAGLVELRNGKKGSVSIGGTVSPAGGNFEEPVTQGTLKVVGAFHGLSYDRSYARKYPAIHPLESWSKYLGCIDIELTEYVRKMLFRSDEVSQMMKVIGEEGTSLNDYIIFLKGDFIDEVYLQQNSFHKVDEACAVDRQQYIFNFLFRIVSAVLSFNDKDEARTFFYGFRQTFKDWNYSAWDSDEFRVNESKLNELLESKKTSVEEDAQEFYVKLENNN